jgi:hypothetical protein
MRYLCACMSVWLLASSACDDPAPIVLGRRAQVAPRDASEPTDANEHDRESDAERSAEHERAEAHDEEEEEH